MKFDAVLFDCDGVLVDSEAITCGVLRDMLQAQGWTLSLRECMDIFVGKMVADARQGRAAALLRRAYFQRP